MPIVYDKQSAKEHQQSTKEHPQSTKEHPKNTKEHVRNDKEVGLIYIILMNNYLMG